MENALLRAKYAGVVARVVACSNQSADESLWGNQSGRCNQKWIDRKLLTAFGKSFTRVVTEVIRNARAFDLPNILSLGLSKVSPLRSTTSGAA